jgi:PadR family transcriptional regulator PadR
MSGSDLYTGTLDILVLKSLASGRRHGYAIGLWLREASAGTLGVKEGVLYPALHRLERRGWARSRWGATDTGRRAKFYELTAAGRKHLAAEAQRLTAYSKAVLGILTTS